MFSRDYIEIIDLYTAYKKAKFEAFSDNSHPSAISFANYEQNLETNLLKLYEAILNNTWFESEQFLGSHCYVPKSVKEPQKSYEDVHFCALDPIEDWKLKYAGKSALNPDVKMRLVIDPTVDYQVLSALWIIKVGHKYEEKVNQDYSYANSLRRIGEEQDLNMDCPGLFTPYYGGYRNWRSNGLRAMKRAIATDNRISAVTMDVTSVYHNSSAKF